MAPKAAKRSVEYSLEPKACAKRRKLVYEAIMDSETFPVPCREMLCSLIAPCLGLKKESRDEFVTAGVGLLTRALDTRGVVLANAIEDAKSEIAAVAEATAKCNADIRELDEAMAAKREDVLAKKALLANHQSTAIACAATLKKAMAAQSAAVDDLTEVREHQDNLEKVIAEHLVPLTGAPPTQRRYLKNHLAAVEQTVESLGLDKALTLAIPTAFLKPLEKRSGFDQLVIEHVSKALAGEVKKQSENIERATLAISDRDAEVQAALSALQAAESQQSSGSQALAIVQTEKVALGAQLRDAKAAQRKLVGKAEAAASAKVVKEQAFQVFQEVQSMFFFERDGQQAPKAEILPAVAEATLAAAGA